MRTALLLPLAVLGCARAECEPRASEGPLVIELFTSQGCSSCPPADRLFGKLAKAGTFEERSLAPLSFHVDYWNELGWTDPFSLPAWTQRQQQYARSLHDERVYTPELVVGGAKGVVGSAIASVKTAIIAAPRPALLAASATWDVAQVEVTANAPADADVWVAIWETETTTNVTRGENAGDKLASDHVVRRLERVATAGTRGTVTVKIDSAWRTVGAVAFAQRGDRRIVASALLPH